jgi:hypothetical protein
MGITLIWASVDKILYPGQFADMIYNYKIMPSFAIHPMAIILPWLEFTTGIVLIIGFWLEGALFIFNSLMLIFIIALSSALIRGLNIQCGCFTVDPNADREIMISLVRDLFMFLAGMWGMRQVLYQKFHIQSL